MKRTAVLTQPNGKRRKKFKELELIKNWGYYLMAFPAMALFFMFVYMSMPGVLLAFKRYTVSGKIWGSPWCGLENFKAYFTGPDFVTTTVNTFVINLMGFFFGTTFTLLCAILLNEVCKTRNRRIFQTILYLPTFLSVMLCAKFVQLLFSNNYGLINQLRQIFGFDSIKFYSEPKYWKWILLWLNLWKGTGSGVIIYLASISGQDEAMYEAARIDGAGRFAQITKIMLPVLSPTIIILALMRIGSMFSGDFQTIYAIMGTNADIKPALNIIETYLYASAMAGPGNYGPATAVALYQSVIGFVLVFGANWLVKLYNKDYALF